MFQETGETQPPESLRPSLYTHRGIIQGYLSVLCRQTNSADVLWQSSEETEAQGNLDGGHHTGFPYSSSTALMEPLKNL